MAERWEWVEIIEPRTKEHMYANLTTGECVWEPPPGVKIKKTDDNQWWELFDANTSRFYYYNATSQKTVWHRPLNCDIIPLAKLQTLKQNTEVRDDDDEKAAKEKREISTQTPDRKRHDHHHSGSVRSQASPRSARRHHHHHKSGSQTSGRYDRVDQFLNGDRHRRQDASTDTPPRLMDSPRSLQRKKESRGEQTLPVNLPMRRDSFPREEKPELPPHQFEHMSKTLSREHTRHEAHPAFQRQGSFGQEHYMRNEYANLPRSDSFTKEVMRLREAPPTQDVGSNYSPLVPPPTDGFSHSAEGAFVSQRPRRFPRTNPSYMPRREGQVPIRKPASEQQASPNIDRHGFLEQQPPAVPPPPVSYQLQSNVGSHSAQTNKTYDNDSGYIDSKGRHERSDSDLSHSSYRGYHERTGSQNSQSSLSKLVREHSDSHSSHSSLKNAPDAYSSQGSLRSGIEHMAFDSPSHEPMTDSAVHDLGLESNLFPNEPVREVCIDSIPDESKVKFYLSQTENREPEYVNLPNKHQEEIKVTIIDSSPEDKSSNDVEEKNIYTDDRSPYIETTENLSEKKEIRSLDYASVDVVTNVPLNQQLVTSRHQNVPFEGHGDQGYEDSVSESSSVFSTPSPKTRPKVPRPPKVPQSVHASLKRRKNGDKMDMVNTPTLEKSQSLQQDLTLQRPLSLVVSQSEVNIVPGGTLSRQSRAGTVPTIRASDPSTLKSRKQSSEVDLEMYVSENLNQHKKGLLGKKLSMSSMLEWTKDLIQKPMIRTADKTVKKEAPEIFKAIQTYMGDRKCKPGDITVAHEIVMKGWTVSSLRDEIYIQLSRQTTGNMKEDSLQLGWELLAVCLAFFPPTAAFQEFLVNYIVRHTDISNELTSVAPVDTRLKLLMSSYYQVPVTHFAQICLRRLEKISQSGPKKGIKKPSQEEIEQAKRSIYHPSMFGHLLQDIMAMQAHRFPERQLPWIQTTLSEEVLKLNGAQTEGIFRVPGDIDDVNALKLKFDQWIPPADISDPHVPASLLKQWYRELLEPLIPPDKYEECIENYDNPEVAIAIVHSLPDINRLVLLYLIRFLQVFAAPENAAITKMDVNNLAMVMAPNCLRCQSDDPRIILENTRKEMAFLRTLIQSLDTTFMEGVI